MFVVVMSLSLRVESNRMEKIMASSPFSPDALRPVLQALCASYTEVQVMVALSL